MSHSHGSATAADELAEGEIEMIAESPLGNHDSTFCQPISNHLSICLP
jgi:hypothetical protein